MWEWLMTKTTEIVKSKYKDENIKGLQRDDVVQEIMMYLFGNKALAEKIYAEKSVGLLYSISKSVIFGLGSEGVFKDKLEKLRYIYVQKICEQFGIEPVPENAYKVAAVVANADKVGFKIPEGVKKNMDGISSIKKLLEISKYSECELIDS